MNVKLPLGIVILLAALAGYLLGTEAGRAQRDMILVKLGRGGDSDAADAVSDAADAVADAVGA